MIEDDWETIGNPSYADLLMLYSLSSRILELNGIKLARLLLERFRKINRFAQKTMLEKGVGGMA